MPVLKVGYIGIGKIGSLIAENVLNAGFPLAVFDVQQDATKSLVEKGATGATSPRELASFADVIALSVKDDDQVRDVVLGENGVLAGARSGSVIVVHSTVEPETAVSLERECAKSGVMVIDAPLSGGPEGAIARSLLFMVGGEAQALELARPVLAASGSTIVHMGPAGSGSMTRIVHHVMLGLNRFSADEGMKLAIALGLDVAKVCQAVQAGEAQSHVIDRYQEKYRDMPTGGQCRVADIAIGLANSRGVSLLGPALFRQLYMNKSTSK